MHWKICFGNVARFGRGKIVRLQSELGLEAELANLESIYRDTVSDDTHKAERLQKRLSELELKAEELQASLESERAKFNAELRETVQSRDELKELLAKDRVQYGDELKEEKAKSKRASNTAFRHRSKLRKTDARSKRQDR